MSKNRIFEKTEICAEHLDTQKWKMVLPDLLNEKELKIFNIRKQAVDLYMKKEKTIEEISSITGLHRNEIRRIAERCLAVDENAEVYGYTALIPNKRITSTKHKSDDAEYSKTGAFKNLLLKYPNIRQKIENLFLGEDVDTLNNKCTSVKDIHRYFIASCHKEKIRENQYPFNTDNLGKRALYRYIKILENEFYPLSVRRYGEEAYQHTNRTGTVNEPSKEIIAPYQSVQFDGHKIDAIFTITFTTLEGDTVTKVLDSIWLLCIIDVATRTTLPWMGLE